MIVAVSGLLSPTAVKQALVDALSAAMPGVDVFYDLPEDSSKFAAGNRWVSVQGGAAEINPGDFAEGLDRWDFTWTFQLLCGSGAHHRSALEADVLAYDLAVEAMQAVDDGTLGLEQVWDTALRGVDRVQEWAEGQQVIVSVAVAASTRGAGTTEGGANG